MTARGLRVAAVLALGWSLVSAGAARAGQDPDAVPSGTVAWGPIRITPSLLLRDMGVDNNVFNETEDPKRDFTFTVTPRAEVVFRMRRLRLAYTTATDYVYYRQYRSERGTNTASGARLEFDLGRLKPYATVQGLNSRQRLNAEVDERARHRDLVYGAGLAMQIASRTHLLLNGSRTRVAFDPDAEEFRGVDLRDSFDGHRTVLDGGIGIDLTPLTRFTLLVARERQQFARSPDRNSDGWRVSPGVTFSPTGLVTGSASVGFRRFHTVSPEVPDYSGFVSAATVGATLSGRHQVQLVVNRDVQYSYDLGTDYYIGTTAGLTWTMAIVGPFDVRGTATRTFMDYKAEAGQAGEETTTIYGGGFGYRVASRARLGMTVEWTRRESDRSPDRRYRNHRIFAGLTWGITP